MKFYVAGKLLDRVEDQEYELLFGVRIGNGKRGYLRKDNWGTGWVYDAEESFRSWCAVAYGFHPVPLSEQEFSLLLMDGIAYLSRERTAEIREKLMTQLSLIAVNS